MDAAVTARLDELAHRYALPDGASTTLARLLDVLAGDETAPTTVRVPAQAVDAHVADSLAGLELNRVRTARRIADLGAGAGFPGVVLAIALPAARVALVESVGRRCAFMQRLVQSAELGNTAVVCRRAEEWPEGLGGHDLVTARALAPLAVLAEYAAPLLELGGALVAYKGGRDRDEEASGAVAAGALGLEPAAVHRVAPFPGAEQRHLHVYVKVAPTPARFPRRPGMARKRPLAR